jgi:predicted enzyme related to lactoylglutathione lyase
MSQPVKNRINGVFVPVRDVAKARDWYSGLLGLSADDEPQHDYPSHLYVVPTEGDCDLVLDEMPMWRGDQPDGPPTFRTPAFMFATDDVYAAHEHVRTYGGEVVTDVHEFGEQGWFVFRDPDGNMLMICGNNPEPRTQ